MKKYILTFELRYTVYSGDEKDYHTKKYTIGEYSQFSEAVLVGNKLVESLNLDHFTTPGINGERFGTPIIKNVKNSLIRNYLRNSSGRPLAEMFIKITTTETIDSPEVIQLCNTIRSFEQLTKNPL